MKTFKITLSIITLSILLVGCSSVKVTDSWKDVRTPTIENKNILIVTESNNQVIRTTFEKDIVKQLSEKGYKSVESFKLFPIMNLQDTLTKEELKDIKKELSSSGINIVVKTILKDINEYSKTYTEGGTVYYQNTYPTYYFDGYHRRFYRSYRTIYMNVEPQTTTTYTSKEYVLETLIYDLTQPEHKQLSSVITSIVDNPKDIKKTSKDFSKKLVNEIIQ